MPEPISKEVIEKILEGAVWVPSPLNTQPLEFVVVTKEEVKEKTAYIP